MTDREPEERTRPRNEDQPDVEGHKIPRGPEDVAGAERIPRLNDDEGPDVEGHRFAR